MTKKNKDNISCDKTKDSETWIFELYIAGKTPRSITTLSNLKVFCEKHLPARYQITLIDLLRQPALAQEKQIFAIPTIIKRSPNPICRSIGDLSNPDAFIIQLDLPEKLP